MLDTLRAPDPTEISLVEHTLRDVLASALPDDTHDMLLAVALERSRLSCLPALGRSLRVFVFGSLYDAVESAFGPDAAREVLIRAADALDALEDAKHTELGSGLRARLKPVASASLPAEAYADPPSSSAPKRKPKRLKKTVRAPRSDEAVVILVSRSAMAWAELDEAIAPDAQVIATARTTAIHDALRSRDAATPVVIDCREGVSDMVLSLIVPELPPGSHVVLWGSRSKVSSLLSHVHTPFHSWVHCDEDVPPLDVAKVIRRFL